eukprot:CAMPEP_0119134258 /NCGR_PEP_ID=MMETSP1310-20130426/16174_1 /TAXON_ID=464262 /ORGANISM="Genus nov. species nov., Strain RCC2339" /LENGTH=289 /DNA_ID=CAMNT_0007125033 /DNA_START=144 /DNA_END=1009 /DNA_ORIENTATION=-
MASSQKFKFAGCQLQVGEDKDANLENARKAIAKAAHAGANMICLPECFNCPYSNDAFPPYAEDLSGLRKGETAGSDVSKSAAMLSAAAKEHSVYLIGGSIPEKDSEGKVYNTSMVFGKDGEFLAKHRKVHLFDIDVPGKIRFMESETLSPGESPTTFDTEYGKIGVAICYDLRFPELSHVMAHQLGCVFLCFPGAFNTTTGPLHWELLLRARASDNQSFVAGVSPARNPDSKYQAWGHTSVIDPMARVLSTTEHNPDIVYADIDLSLIPETRSAIPIRNQRRHSVYKSP